MYMKALLTLILSSAMTASAFAANVTANPKAPTGGNFVYNLGGEPTTVHPITSTDLYSRYVKDWVCDTLAVHDYATYEYTPRLAESGRVSKDNKVFTFFLRKEAVFHDGTPVTAEDVKFSFDAIFEPKYEAAHLRPYFDGIQKVEVVDPHTVKVYTKDLYFANFDSIVTTMMIIPKRFDSDVAKSKHVNY